MRKACFCYALLATVMLVKPSLAVSGDDGDIHWEINQEGVLTISPKSGVSSASIPDYDADKRLSGSWPDAYRYSEQDTKPWVTNAPWGSYAYQITAIEVSDGVTDIGSYAFYGLRGATDIVLSEGLKTIGSNSFGEVWTTNLIELPKSLEEVKQQAFWGTGGKGQPSFLIQSNFELGFVAFGNAPKFLCEEADPDHSANNPCYQALNVPNGVNMGYLNKINYYKEDENGVISSRTRATVWQYYTSLDEIVDGTSCGTYDECKAIVASRNETLNSNSGVDSEINGVSGGGSAGVSNGENGIFSSERGKRIYTVQQANEVAGKKNRVMIRYK